jgi:hypothetical protein
MPRPDLWFAIALLAACGVAGADPVDLKPFRATYSADWKGMSAATSTLELKRGSGDTYVYETVNTPKGMFRLALPDSLTQASTFRLSDGRVVPLEYRGSDEKERPIDLKFDWQAKRVSGTAKGSPVDLEIPPTAQDPMSLQIASLRNLAKGTLQDSVALVDGDGKLKDYELRQEGTAQLETALGTLETIVYTSRRAGSDRMTRSWVAPALGYLPVKAERIRKNKVEFTLRIESVDK